MPGSPSHPESDGKPRRRYVALWVLLIILGTVVILLTLQLLSPFLLGPTELRVSQETTYITSPLGVDGLPEYRVALAEIRGEPVAPEHNFMVALVQALGAEIFIEEVRAPMLEALGDPELLPEDQRFVPLGQFDPEADYPYFDGPWTESEHPRIAAWLKRNKRALDKLLAETRRPSAWLPVPWGAAATYCPLDIVRVRSVARVLSSRALRALSQGSVLEAWHDLHSLIELYVLLEQADPTLMGRLSCRLLLTYSFQLLEQLLPYPTPTASAARTLQLINQWSPTYSLVEVLRYERLSAIADYSSRVRVEDFDDSLAEILGVPEVEIPWLMKKDQFVDTNTFLEQINRWYDGLDRAAACTNYWDSREALDQRQQDWDEQFEIRASARKWQRFQVYFMTPGQRRKLKTLWLFDRSIQSSLLDMTRHHFWDVPAVLAVMRGAIAAVLYREKNRDLPRNLPELVPTFLATVPIDPYSSDPIRYRTTKTGFVVYSVGEDLEDDGGDPEHDRIQINVEALR